MANTIEIMVKTTNMAALASAIRSVNSAVQGMKDEVRMASTSMQESLAKAGESAKVMGTEVRDAGLKARQAGSSMQNAGSSADHLGSHLDGVKGKARDMGLAIWGAAKMAGTALAAAGLAAAGYGIKQAAANQTAMVSFEVLLGSARKAQDFLKKLQAFAAATPFDLPSLKDAASHLLAVGVNVKDVIPLMTRLGDATAGMGTGAEGIQRAVLALQQIKTAGVVHAGDLLQLTEAGIPAWDALAAHMHTSIAKIKSDVEKGKIKPEDLFAAIEKGEGPALSRLKGMMEKQSATLEGVWSTFKDNLGQTLATAFAPAVPALTKFLNWAGNEVPKAIDKIKQTGKDIFKFLKDTGTLDMLKKVFSSFHYGNELKDIKKDSEEFIKTVKEHWPEIKQIIGTVAAIIGAVLWAILKLIDGVIKLDTIMVSVWSGLVIVIDKAAVAIADILVKILTVAAKIPGPFQAGFKSALAAAKSFRKNMQDQIDAIHGKSVTVTEKLGVIVKTAITATRSTAQRATGGIVGGAADGGIKGALTWVGEQGRELVNLPAGSTVYPHGQSERMAAEASSRSDDVQWVRLESSDTLMRVFISHLQRHVRDMGGDSRVLGIRRLSTT